MTELALELSVGYWADSSNGLPHPYSMDPDGGKVIVEDADVVGETVIVYLSDGEVVQVTAEAVWSVRDAFGSKVLRLTGYEEGEVR